MKLVPLRIQQEAWKMVLDGAESYVEDAIDENGDFSEEEFEQVIQHAYSIIAILKVKSIK